MNEFIKDWSVCMDMLVHRRRTFLRNWGKSIAAR